jgi:hypothetical protein
MDVQCTCGKFRARLTAFPKNTPGRLVCYCDDCQTYLHFLGRADLLDANGGTEVIPTYPADVEVTQGKQFLKCTRLSPKGTFRFSTTCCNTPIVNTRPGAPWAGFLRVAYPAQSQAAVNALGPVRSRIMGQFAKGKPPPGTPDTFNLKAMASVLPFIVKGKLLKKTQPSPFFAADGLTAITEPYVLSKAERAAAAQAAQGTV